MVEFTAQSKPQFPYSPRPIISIGAGGIVNDAHLPAYTKAGFPVIGIIDMNQVRARQVAEAFGIPTVHPSLEAAVAAAPDEVIFDIAIPASALPAILPQLPDGAAVLFQKPMGESLDEARIIRDICHSKGLVAAVNFQLRYAPFVIAARDMIERGLIGEVHDMEVRVTVYTPWHLWTFLEDVEFMEVTYHSIHYLDLVRSFFGEPTGIYARSTKLPTTTKLDSVRTNMILDYGDSRRAAISTNHNHAYGLKHQESYIMWEGTEGAIIATMGLLMNYPKGVPNRFEYCVLRGDARPEWHSLDIAGSWFPDGFMGTMASLQCYVEGSADELPTSVDDVFKTMALVNAARRSNESGSIAPYRE